MADDRDPNDDDRAPGLDPTLTADYSHGTLLADDARWTPEPGASIGRYTLRERLGAGAGGVVFRAHDTYLDRAVALKLLRQPETTGAEPTAQTRLLREGQAIAQLSHPNVVTVYDVGVERGTLYIAMEFVDGESLHEWLDKDRSLTEVLDAFEQAGAGLAAAHAKGLIHRDFKPANVMMDSDGRVQVADFGLARGVRAPAPAELTEGELHPRASLDETITLAGAQLGTPAYMAPEQLAGRRADATADQYAFCVALRRALAGERPFRISGVGPDAQRERQSLAALPPSGKAPRWLDAAVERGLRPDPADRWPSMADLLGHIRRRRTRPRRIARLAAGAAVVAAFAGVLATRGSARPEFCRDVDAPVRDVWNDARRTTLRSAFVGAGGSLANDTWVLVQRQLDEQAERWAAARIDACRATHVRGEQSTDMLDRRVQCLDASLRDFEGLLVVFEIPDVEVLRRSTRAVASLGDARWCANAETLPVYDPPPQDPTQRAELERVQVEIAAVQARLQAGGSQTDHTRARDAAAAARALAKPTLVSSALLRLGRSLALGGEIDGARDAYEEAVLWAERSGDVRTRANATLQLAYVESYLAGDTVRAQRHIAHARAMLARFDRSDPLHGRADQLEAVVLTAAGRVQEALALAERSATTALRELEKAGDDPAERRRITTGWVVPSMFEWASMLDETERSAEALAVWEDAVPRAAEAFGEASSWHALALHGHGRCLSQLGRYAEAEAINLRVIALFEALYGRQSVQVALGLHNLANALRSQGKHPEAVAAAREALAIRQRALPAGHMMIPFTHRVLAIALRANGELDESLAQIRVADELMRAAVGDRHPHTARTLYWKAEILLTLDRLGDAEATFERARRIRVALADGEETDSATDELLGLSRVALARGDDAQAIRLGERTRALTVDDDYETRGGALFVIARATWRLGRNRQAALAAARRARAELTKMPSPEHTDRDQIDAWLAERAALRPTP